MKQLNLGCGGYPLDGWINYDLVEHPLVEKRDLRNGFPLENDSVDRIFSEHFLEHLSFEDGERLLRDCYRVLKPGGQFLVVMPDLAKLVAAYYNDDWLLIHSIGLWDCNQRSHCKFLNQAMRAWGHTFLWDQRLFAETANAIGYNEIICNLGWPVSGWPGYRYMPTDMRVLCQK